MAAPSGNICSVSLESRLMFPSTLSGNFEILGKKNQVFPREQSLTLFRLGFLGVPQTDRGGGNNPRL